MQADERAKKIAKTHLPSDVSEQRIRAEVQAMLIDVDLASVTLRQLRPQLEARLGLDSGLLSSGKRLQKLIGSIVQQEVIKKSQRGTYCGRVAKALVEFDGYPEETRQMLIESLPHAMPPSGKLVHKHQAQLLLIARDALSNARCQARHVQGEFFERTRAEAADLHAFVVERDAASTREASALGTLEAAEGLLRGAEKEVWLTTLQLEKAKEAVKVAHEDMARKQQAKQDAIALRDGLFPQLVDGALPPDERIAALAKVTDVLRQENAEASLVAAAPIGLARDPEARSAFERVIVDAVKARLAEHISNAEAQLALLLEPGLGSAVPAAEAAAEAARARVAEQEDARDRTRAARETAATEHRAAEAALLAKQEAAQPRLAEQQRLAEKVQELDGILAGLDELIASGPQDKVTLPPVIDEAGFTSPRKVATPMAERGLRCGSNEGCETV